METELTRQELSYRISAPKGIPVGTVRVFVKSRPHHSDGRAWPPSAASSGNEGIAGAPLPIGSPHSKGDTVKDSFLSRNFSHET